MFVTGDAHLSLRNRAETEEVGKVIPQAELAEAFDVLVFEILHQAEQYQHQQYADGNNAAYHQRGHDVVGHFAWLVFHY